MKSLPQEIRDLWKEKNSATGKLVEASSSQKDNSSLHYLLFKITGINRMMKDSLNIVIAGATGYVGLELVKILCKHPKINIKYLCATKSIGKKINYFDNNIPKNNLPKISKINTVKWKFIDIIFTALPNGEAQKIVNKIPKNIKVIDLSGDFRLNNHNTYKKWYGLDHCCKKEIKNSIYAVSEFVKKNIKDYRIISCPGCYPTSIQLPLIPLVKNKMIDTKNIIVDSKSGFSGAGKNIKNKFKFKNLLTSVSSYSVGGHKHMPEINQELSIASKKKINISFTPHLMPMFRGILSTIYLKASSKYTAKKIYNYLKKYHKNNYFIKFAKFNSSIGTGDVINTNYCKIAVCEDKITKKIIIISTIDNLLKGASGQAVQNMNIAFGLNERVGLK